MMVGLDFDNTIACYDAVYRGIVDDMDVVPPDTPANKTAIRDWLRGAGQEDVWTELQGYVYGDGMRQAEPFTGVSEFIAACTSAGFDVCIVSHRTKEPYAGPKVDLHAAARTWLDAHGIVTEGHDGLSHEKAFFELTKTDKMKRIGSLLCDWFVDDLPEFLMEPEFPKRTKTILFDPGNIHSNVIDTHTLTVATSWQNVKECILAGGD